VIETKIGEIYEIVDQYLPADWENFIMHAIMTQDRYDIVFYVKVHSQYFQCFNLFDAMRLPQAELTNLFQKLYELCLPECTTFQSFSLKFEWKGHFKIDYHYDEDGFDIERWKEKYLT